MSRSTTKKILIRGAITLVTAAIVIASILFVRTLHIDMLNPAGIIALKERNLMAFTVLLGALVIIPVFIMTIAIAVRYREGNKKAVYKPEWGTNHLAEVIWWGIPILIIGTLAVVTWQSTHHLDPYKPLPDHEKTLTIQVVALDWKWLFIYPEQNIATVNYVQFPTNTSVRFDLTSDTVMNSFWIPKLSGQLYAMPGMVTKLHLNATEEGDYKGSAANISGKGFAGMKFIARASSEQAFNSWVSGVKNKPATPLTIDTYALLVKPSENNPVSYYTSVPDGFYDTIVMKYMMPTEDGKHDEHSPSVDEKPVEHEHHHHGFIPNKAFFNVAYQPGAHA